MARSAGLWWCSAG